VTLLYVDFGGKVNNLQVGVRTHIHVNNREDVTFGLLGDTGFV